MIYLLEDIDNDYDGILRLLSGIFVGVIIFIFYIVIDYLYRFVSSRSVRFSCVNSDNLINNF